MSKNSVIVNGSPRKNGNTEILVDASIMLQPYEARAYLLAGK